MFEHVSAQFGKRHVVVPSPQAIIHMCPSLEGGDGPDFWLNTPVDELMNRGSGNEFVS
jgi:hypothetical protein